MPPIEPTTPRSATIRARRDWNSTGITVMAGHTYQLEATGKWTDLIITRDANGYATDEAPFLSRASLRKHEARRRMPHENWFVLVGGIDRDHTTTFRIGTGCVYVAPRTGELTCFANDDPSFYWNNWGSIELMVTPVA